MAEQGFAVEFNIDPQGSELDVAATATDTVLYLGDASDYDAPGTVRVDNGTTQVDVDLVDVDPDVGTVTLATVLGIAADVGDRVYILSADEIAVDHTLEVHTADGDAVDIAVDYADRILWEPGPIDPPVPVVVSDDLTEIVDVPGRRALVNPFAFEAPLFVGYLAANQSIPTVTYTTLTGWTVRFLRGGMTYDATSSAVVVPLSGMYSISDSAVTWAASTAGRRGIQATYNTAAGAVLGAEFRQDASNDPTSQTLPMVTPLMPLEAGESVILRGWQNTGGNLDVQGSALGTLTFLSVEYRGPL